MNEETTEKLDAASAKAKVALDEAKDKTKAVWSEIKTNFKADEGMSGAKKIQSMFVNLWKSGTTGKAALIACVVASLLLPCFFGSNRVSKIVNLKHEIDEVMVELCELDDLLGHKDMLVPWMAGRSLEDEANREKEMKEIRTASSKELDAFITMSENMLKELKEQLKKKKSECQRNGIEIDGTSPLRLAKRFILYLRAKDVGGMEKLINGDAAVKENAVKHILEIVNEAADGAVERIDQLEHLGPTFFNKKHDKAGVAVEDESKALRLVTGTSNYTCLSFVKTKDGWLVDGNRPFCRSEQISNVLLDF